MIRKIDMKDMEQAKKVLELQLASYSIEAELIGYDDIPPLKDTLQQLQASEEVFYGFYRNTILAGVISYKIIDNVLDIHRMMVSPPFFRKGIASKLLSFIFEQYKHLNEAMVSTGTKNIAAVQLYSKYGFKEVEKVEIAPDVYITNFKRTTSPSNAPMKG